MVSARAQTWKLTFTRLYNSSHSSSSATGSTELTMVWRVNGTRNEGLCLFQRLDAWGPSALLACSTCAARTRVMP
eukprot:7384854-Prymnesium_polylepis.2